MNSVATYVYVVQILGYAPKSSNICSNLRKIVRIKYININKLSEHRTKSII